MVTRTLPNGVTCIVWPEPRDAVVSTQIWVRVGSSHETPGKTGLAHMLEHLMFRGTERVPDGEFDRRMEALGASINAMTWLDFTSYMSTAPAESLSEILALEADRFAGLALTPAVFAAERSVVANERRQVVDADPVARLHELVATRALVGSSYEWPTIGWGDDIARFELDDVVAFHAEHYAPQNLCVVICGCVETEAAFESVSRTFGGLAPRPCRPATLRGAAPRAAFESVSLPLSAPRLALAYTSPARIDPRWPAWSMTNEILCGGEASRLPARLEVRERIVLDVTTSLGAHALPAMFDIEVALRPRVRFERVLAAIREELECLALDGPSDLELHTAKMRGRTQDALALATTGSRAEWAGESWVMCGDPLHGFAVSDHMAEVTADEVRDVARALLEGTERVEVRGVPSTPGAA